MGFVGRPIARPLVASFAPVDRPVPPRVASDPAPVSRPSDDPLAFYALPGKWIQMGLRCTVFGHKWGEVGTEREREETDDEVLLTVREVRTCRRCGSEEVLGESKEVTALESGAPEQREATGETATAGTGDDEVASDPETDDGVILEDDATEDGRGSREWPGRPEREGVEERDGEPGPWPESAREQETDAPEEAFVGVDEVAEQQPRPDVGDSGVEGDVRSDTGGDADRSDRAERPGTVDDPAGAGDVERTGDDDGAEGGRSIPEPDDDGIIEAGGTPGTDEEPGGDGPPDESGPGTDDAGQTNQREGNDADDGVEIPRAEESARSGDTSDEDVVDEGASRDGARDVDAGNGDDPDDEPALGTDEPPAPDDDAEVLEATEPNEQSRITAEDPVDPSEAGGPVDRGETFDAGERLDGTRGREAPPEGSPPERRGGEGGPGGGDDPPSLDPTDPPSDAEPAPEDVEFFCPECGYTDQSRWPSRRAGDICPDCQRSYLAERKT